MRLFNWQFPYQTVTFVTRISEYWPMFMFCSDLQGISFHHKCIVYSVEVYFDQSLLKINLIIHLSELEEGAEVLFLLCYTLLCQYFPGHEISRSTGSCCQPVEQNWTLFNTDILISDPAMNNSNFRMDTMCLYCFIISRKTLWFIWKISIGYCLILKIYFKYRFSFLVVQYTLDSHDETNIYLCKIKLFYFSVCNIFSRLFRFKNSVIKVLPSVEHFQARSVRAWNLEKFWPKSVWKRFTDLVNLS